MLCPLYAVVDRCSRCHHLYGLHWQEWQIWSDTGGQGERCWCQCAVPSQWQGTHRNLRCPHHREITVSRTSPQYEGCVNLIGEVKAKWLVLLKVEHMGENVRNPPGMYKGSILTVQGLGVWIWRAMCWDPALWGWKAVCLGFWCHFDASARSGVRHYFSRLSFCVNVYSKVSSPGLFYWLYRPPPPVIWSVPSDNISTLGSVPSLLPIMALGTSHPRQLLLSETEYPSFPGSRESTEASKVPCPRTQRHHAAQPATQTCNHSNASRAYAATAPRHNQGTGNWSSCAPINLVVASQ